MSGSPSNITPGRGALIAVSGRLIPVWIEHHEGGRLRTISSDGTCRMLAPGRLYWASETSMGGPEELGKWLEGLEAMAAGLDIAAIWSRKRTLDPNVKMRKNTAK